MNQADRRIHDHIVGKTEYIDDVAMSGNFAYGYLLYSPHAHAKILSIDTSDAKKLKGVFAVLTHEDIPGINNMGSVLQDEPVLSDGTCQCVGQAIALIAATDRATAEKAKSLIKIKYKVLRPILDVQESFHKGNYPFNPYHLVKGDIKKSFRKSDHIVEGEMEIGGQEHFYLETQGAVSYLLAYQSYKIIASSQNPSEIQLHISRCLGIDCSQVEVVTSHLGGGFGGKETQGAWCAIWAALLSYHTGKNIKFILSRDEDMVITGKRHPVKVKYKVGFSDQGKILAYKARFLFNMGYCADLTQSIMERCLLHSENAYYIPSMEVEIYPCRTNTPSNCAFRGFGAPQGVVVIENIMDIIAHTLHRDPLIVRRDNFYGIRRRNITPYGKKVSDNSLPDIYKKLVKSSDYKERVREVKRFNSKNKFKKRGIAGVPVKFGISFTTSFLNQGSALVNLYRDGSMIIHQGGVEMGQGLYDKMMLTASRMMNIPEEKIRIYNTDTSVIPNTSATAASTGSDINGQAVIKAIRSLKKRIDTFAKTLPPDTPFEEVLKKAYMAQINLGEKAYYKTPGVYFNKTSCKGNPFLYYVFGLGISEVEVDLLTGDTAIIRTDILNDTGISLDKSIDKGQIEGAFIQCVGWLTMEELISDPQGHPLTCNPDLYKIPGIADVPKVFNVGLYEDNKFNNGVLGSRAIGEPPFLYGISVVSAINNAIYSATHTISTDIKLPATKESIFKKLHK